jgi:iron complex outermembrane recepter protein
MMSKRPRFSPTRMVAGLALAGVACATMPVANAQDDERILEEVITTARKISEDMQTVPVSVSAFSGDTIDAMIMRDIREIEGLVPNLVFDAVSVAPAGASIYIRGVGTQDVERSFDPAVGVVVDGVPQSFVNGSMANTFDFASIEVLRGPQGTLFGRNTTGGVVNINRTRPTGELGLKYEVVAGNNDRIDFNGVFNFPLGDMLSAKLGYAQQKDGGLRTNVLLDEDVGNADNEEITATLLFEPTEDFDALFTYVNYTDQNDGIPLQNATSRNVGNTVNPLPETSCLPGLDVIFGACGDDIVDDLNDLTQDWYNPIDFEWDSFSLNMNWDVGVGTITSITGYQETEESVPTDFDGSSLNFFHALRDQESEQKTQELRFASSQEMAESWDFVAGVFWLEDEYQMEQNTSIAAFGGPDGAVFQNPFTTQERESWAVFGEAHIGLGEKTTLTLGGRYTEEEKDFCGEMNIGGGDFAGYLPSGVNSLHVFGTPIFIPISQACGSEKWDEFTPKVGLDYQVNDDVLAFANYSEGFKSGGFNGRNSTAESIGPYQPEFVENFEIGMKGDFADNTIRFNAAAFYSDYSDKQEEIIQPDDFGGSNTVVLNAATVKIMGLEGEMTWVATQNLTLTANLGWLDAEYDDYNADINGDGNVTDNSHLELRRIPEWTGGVTGAYNVQIGPGNLSAYLSYRYTDDYWVEASNDPRGVVDSRGVLDANIAYEWQWDSGRSVQLALFGRDLTDEYGYNSAVVIPGTIAFGGVAGGQEYGLRLSGNF